MNEAVSESNQDMGGWRWGGHQFSRLPAYTIPMKSGLVLLPLALLALACSKGEPPIQGYPLLSALDLPPGLLQQERALDLVVVSVDTLRADRLPFYGAERATAGDPDHPWSLAGLARRGTVWEQVWAPAGMTLPSFGSFWTGRSTLEHGAPRNFGQVQAATFAMELADAGWENHAVVSNRVLHKRSGLQRGFQSYQLRVKEREAEGPETLLAQTAATIQESRRALIWAHYMAPHQPYTPASAYRGRWSQADGLAGEKALLESIHAAPDSQDDATLEHLRALYDEEILTVNDYVEQVLSGLDRQYRDAGRGGLLDNAVVVLMSDHGEELADRHGYFMHAKSLYAGVTRVPLVLLGGGWPAGARQSRAIALQHVLPMVLNGRQPRDPVLFSSWDSRFFAAREGDWTLIHNPNGDPNGPVEPPTEVAYPYPQVALFDRRHDPLELEDVSRQHPEVTRRLLDALHAWYWSLENPGLAENQDLSAEDIQALIELGYATPGADGALEVHFDRPWEGSQWKP